MRLFVSFTGSVEKCKEYVLLSLETQNTICTTEYYTTANEAGIKYILWFYVYQ